MSLVIARIDGDTENRIESIRRQLTRPRRLFIDIGARISRLLQDHFTKRNRTGNKLGGKRTNFWAELRSATRSKADDAKAEVTVAHPAILQKLYGGTIRKRDRKLAIPATAEAYSARTPRAMSGLRVIPFPNVTALVDANERVQFWLKDSITQLKDPDTLPKEKEMVKTVDQGLKKFAERLGRSGRSGGRA